MKEQAPLYEAWKRQFDRLLLRKHYQYANNSWEQLVKKGLDRDVLPFVLWLACDFPGSPGHDATSEFRDESKRKTKETRQLAIRLKADKVAIVKLCGGVAQKDLIAKLDVLTDELETSATELHRFSSKRVCNPSMFRSWLIRQVKNETKRSHYQEISHLLDVAYAAHGKEKPLMGQEVLRMAYSRQTKNHEISWDLSPETVLLLLLGFIFLKLSELRSTSNETAPRLVRKPNANH